MKRRYNSAVQVAVPVRSLLYRMTVALLFFLSLAVLVIGKTNPNFTERVRSGVTDVMVPFLEVLSAPADAVSRADAWLDGIAQIYSENQRLKAENAELLKVQTAFRDVQAENKSLRKLLNFVPSAEASYVTSRIVGDGGGPYARSAIINSGQTEGIEKNQAVVSENGLVGRVIEVGGTSSRVLLLTDFNSRVPVMGEISRERSILAGDNSDTLSLTYLPADSKLSVGERIITSGDGGAFPPGLPVGIVTSVRDNAVRVKPLVDWSRLEYISVVNYRF